MLVLSIMPRPKRVCEFLLFGSACNCNGVEPHLGRKLHAKMAMAPIPKIATVSGGSRSYSAAR